MFKREEAECSKYKVALVAYKDLSEDIEKDLLYNFISNITTKEDIQENSSDVYKNCSGLSYRTSLYHKWFKDKILKKINEGYRLGIVEIPKSYGNSYEVKLRELDKKFGDHILVIATEEL